MAVEEDRGILFFYDLRFGTDDLSVAEENDLNKLNTISLKDLLKVDNVNDSFIVSSSNVNIVRVLGSQLRVINTGDVTLTIASRQDASANKEIAIKVISSLSELKIYDEDGQEINGGNILNVQRTKTKDLIVTQDKTTVRLGNLATKYDLIVTDIVVNALNVAIDGDGEELGNQSNVAKVNYSANQVSISTDKDTERTRVSISPVVFSEEEYQTAIETAFKKAFVVDATDGVISFKLSGDQITLSPSITTSIVANIQTTAADDTIVPVVSLKDSDKAMEREVVEGKHVYLDAAGNPVIVATIKTKTSSFDEQSGIYDYSFDITFAVADSYKSQVAEDMEFEVYFKAKSESQSNTFKMLLTKQDFTNIDTSSVKITNTSVQGSAVDGYYDEYKTGIQTSTLAPGNSSILKVFVNPEYAYYDYAEISYSGAAIANAVNIEVVQPVAGRDGKIDHTTSTFRTLTDDMGTSQTVGTNLRYTPKTDKGYLYFKLWINTTVERDTTLMFTISFYNKNSDVPLDYVNHYIAVSYLTEPRVLINGQDTAFIAKGTKNEVKVEVLASQRLDSIAIDGTGYEGIALTNLTELPVDYARGIRTYTATLSCQLNAFSRDHGMLEIQATVSRELNGVKEIKTAIATAIIVDFKIDDILVDKAENNELTIWQNVSSPFDVKYKFDPDTSILESDNDSLYQDEKEEILNKRAFFEKNHYYPQEVNSGDSSQSEYYINYIKGENGAFTKTTLLDRIFVEVDGQDVNWKDANLPFEFITNKHTDGSETYQIKGTRAASAPVEIIIKTYLYAGGVESTIETRVKIKVETFSDPDLPLPIRSEADFLALGEGSTGPNDYILETDLVLEDYTPFDTSNIRSLDGNGYTIYIKSFKIEESGPLNLALFKTVTKLTVTNTNPAEQTTLKNLRVNYYNGGQVIVDISNHKEIYMAGIAIENSGVITNCEVVSYYTDGLLEEPGNNTLGVTRKGLKLNSLPKGTKEGFNLSYRNGANVSEESFIADNSGITSQIAGFVLRNNGSITNSRVGGDSVMLFKDNTELASSQAREFITKALGVFNIVGQGDISGFVLSNNGHIASSFVKNIDIQNNSAATKFYTAGFVGQNSSSSSIITSYIEGVRSTISSEDANNATERNRKKYANLGSSLKSEMGYLAGFAYINEGNIKDSYSNILIANSTDLQKVYLASGFVYQNDGTLENCYSASQVANANYAQMNFSGVDATGQLLKQGKYINCYFFNADDYSSEGQEDTDSSTESQFNTGALSIKDPSLKTSFYGFAVADAGEDVLHKDGIWEIDAEYGLKLIEPDYITYSHRKKIFVEGDVGTITATYDGKKYHLGYVELISSTDSNNRISTILGTYHNPILVYDASDWQEIANINAASSYIKAQVDEISVKGVYRLVNNINLSSIHQELYSSTKNFSGALYGNGFVISGISLAQNSEVTVDKYGMFASVVAEQGKPALISNVDLQITKVTAGNAVAVGGLAGIVKNANIINIDVSFEDNAGAANVAGKNFVGGLIGLAYGDNKIKNITATNPNVVAASLFEYNDESFLTAAKESISSFRNSIESELQIFAAKFSYAGSIVGFLDNYTQEGVTNFTGDDAETETYSINNIKVYGNVIIQGQVVGGVFGLTGYNTNIRDVGLVLNATDENASHIISTGFFAGGVVGQSFGKLSRVFAEHESSVQQQIEDGMGDFYGGNYTGAERGILTLFDTSKMEKQHKQKAVGGLVGYIGSGMMEVSYSKLNATSMSAQYAGGIVGMMDVQKAPQGYDVDLDRLAEKENGINYFFNEVFATGDVRANTMAGGLVGAIKGQESKIVMLSVNAFNYLTTYNYQTEKYEDLNLGQYEVSSNFHINSFVGQFIYFDEEGKEHIEELKTDINKNDVNNQFYEIKCGSRALSDYIKFAEGLDSLGDSSTNKEQTSQGEKLPSVARYVNYSFKGQEVRLSRFGENILDKDGSYDKTNEESLDDLYKIYGIESASKYANSTAGRTYTQVGFIGSGVWSFTNWIHPMDDLFPSFRLKETYSVMYLDVYNAAYVFTEMANDPSLVVIVRGLKTKGGDPELPGSIGDIVIKYNADAKKFENEDERTNQDTDGNIVATFLPVTEFAGRIIGGRYQKEDGEDVKIITAGTLFESTAPGFTVSNQTFVFTGTNGAEQGLFTNAELSDASITNLTIETSALTLTVEEDPNRYAGLVAPRILNSNIDGVNIVSNATSGESILTVNLKDGSTPEKIYAGLITGQLVQSSVNKIMTVKNLSVKNANDQDQVGYVGVSEGSVTSVINVGGYFGSIEKPKDTEGSTSSPQALRVTYGDEKLNDNASVSVTATAQTINIGGFAGYVNGARISTNANQNGQTPTFTIKTPDISSIEESTLNAGGFIGQTEGEGVEGISFVSTLKSTTTFGALTATNVYAGGFVGKADGFGSLVLKDGLVLDTTFGNITAPNVYAGGFFGQLAASTATEIVGNTNGKSIATTFANVSATTEANIGGLVGLHGAQIGETAAGLEISGFSSVGFETGTINSAESTVGGLVGKSTQALTIAGDTQDSTAVFGTITEVTGDNATVGSLVGYSEAASASGKSLAISEKINSTINANIKSTTSIFGGMVGEIYGQSGTATTNAQIGSGDLLRYNGKVEVNNTSANITFGGMVGSLSQGKGTLTVNKNSFGGQLYVKDAATVTAGGSIGSIASDVGDGKAQTINLYNSYNYGDVFVDYASCTKTLNTDYTFGGLIGKASSASYSISENYSAMTSHNSRYETYQGTTAHALIGSGNIASGMSKTKNVYSHAVCLLTDDHGTDIGYQSAYNASRLGYNRASLLESESTIINKITDALGGKEINGTNFAAGHKLKPKVINKEEYYPYNNEDYIGLIDGTSYIFNGVTYYTLSQDYSIEDQGFKTAGNVAIIGDSHKITFTNTNADVRALFDTASGFSFISSLILDVDIDIEEVKWRGSGKTSEEIQSLTGTSETGYASLGTTFGQNTQVYAVNAYGEMEVGGNTYVKNEVYDYVRPVALVWNTNGKIFDSSTDIDIVYRATEKYGVVSAFATMIGNALIENSYVMGSIQTLGGGTLYGFGDASGTGNKINNCYTAVRFDGQNYITLNDDTTMYNHPTDKACVEAIDFSYCKDANNREGSSGNSFEDMTAVESADSNKSTILKGGVVDQNFNYGYPTLKYQYLKRSSFAATTNMIADCGDTEHRHGTQGSLQNSYDCYIITYEYTRLENGQVPNGATTLLEDGNEAGDNQSWRYMIPNAGVLAKISEVGVESGFADVIEGDYVLMYDIDLKKTSFYDSDTQKVTFTSLGDFKGYFDGQGRTISSLPNSLFTTIDQTQEGVTSKIRNLRLTDVTGSSPALAGEISNAYISNMTLSGSTTANAGLATTITNSGIYAVTNMIKIDSTAVNVGGITGVAKGSTTLKYCSNYGPISSEGAAEIVDGGIDENAGVCVGGLIGATEGAVKVLYSYNATSVLNNYTTTNTGNFYAGGLVGYAISDVDAYLEILNSYNSGMVKAGGQNKSNTKESHAGGILAGGTATISNCYNEGSVEALAANAEYTVEWLNDGEYNLTSNSKLVVKTSTSQNVWAYAIGPGITEGQKNIAKVSTNNGNERPSVLANGAALNASKESPVTVYEQTFEKNGTEEKDKIWMTQNGTYSNKQFNWYELNTSRATNDGTHIQLLLSYQRDSIMQSKEDNLKQYNTTVVNKNFLDLPLDISYYLKSNLILSFYGYKAHNVDNLSELKDKTLNKLNDDNRTTYPALFLRYSVNAQVKSGSNYEYLETKYYYFNRLVYEIPEQFIYGLNESNTEDTVLNEYLNLVEKDAYIPYSSNTNDVLDDKPSSVAEETIQNTRSQKGYVLKDENLGVDNTIKINGQKFYYADDNSLSIFHAGITKTTIDIDTEFKFAGGVYSVTSVFDTKNTESTTDDENVGFYSYETVDNKGKLTIRLTVYTEKGSATEITPKIKLDATESKSATIDLEGLEYYSKGDMTYAIEGIDLSDENPNYLEETLITSYSNKNSFNSNILKATFYDNRNNEIYFAYDKDNKELIYVQSAKLIHNNEEQEINYYELKNIQGKRFVFEEAYTHTSMLFTQGGTDSYTCDEISSSYQFYEEREYTGQTAYDNSDKALLPTVNALLIDAGGNVAASYHYTYNDGTPSHTWEDADGQLLTEAPDANAGYKLIIPKRIDDSTIKDGGTRTQTLTVGNITAELNFASFANAEEFSINVDGTGSVGISKPAGSTSTNWKSLNGIDVYYAEVNKGNTLVSYSVDGDGQSVYELAFSSDSVTNVDKTVGDTAQTTLSPNYIMNNGDKITLNVYPTYKIDSDEVDAENYTIITTDGIKYYNITSDDGVVSQNKYNVVDGVLTAREYTDADGDAIETFFTSDNVDLIGEIDQYIYLKNTSCSVLEAWEIESLEIDAEETGVYSNKTKIRKKPGDFEKETPSVDTNDYSQTLTGFVLSRVGEQIESSGYCKTESLSNGGSLKASVYYRPSKNADSLTVTVTRFFTETEKNKEFAGAKTSIKDEETLDAAPIILRSDITFNKKIKQEGLNESKIKIVKNSNINIIGNGYNISYYGNALYDITSFGENNSWIRGVNFLGEVGVLNEIQGGFLGADIDTDDTGTGETTFKDVNLYGSLKLNGYGNSSIIEGTRNIIANMQAYVSVDGSLAYNSIRDDKYHIPTSLKDANGNELKGISYGVGYGANRTLYYIREDKNGKEQVYYYNGREGKRYTGVSVKQISGDEEALYDDQGNLLIQQEWTWDNEGVLVYKEDIGDDITCAYNSEGKLIFYKNEDKNLDFVTSRKQVFYDIRSNTLYEKHTYLNGLECINMSYSHTKDISLFSELDGKDNVAYHGFACGADGRDGYLVGAPVTNENVYVQYKDGQRRLSSPGRKIAESFATATVKSTISGALGSAANPDLSVQNYTGARTDLSGIDESSGISVKSEGISTQCGYDFGVYENIIANMDVLGTDQTWSFNQFLGYSTQIINYGEGEKPKEGETDQRHSLKSRNPFKIRQDGDEGGWFVAESGDSGTKKKDGKYKTTHRGYDTAVLGDVALFYDIDYEDDGWDTIQLLCLKENKSDDVFEKASEYADSYFEFDYDDYFGDVVDAWKATTHTSRSAYNSDIANAEKLSFNKNIVYDGEVISRRLTQD